MKKVIFIGQAMPRVKRDPHDWPTLNSWLFSIGITEKDIRDNFLYSALVDYFPGSKKGRHLVPTKDEIASERTRLVQTIREFNPDIVVTVGKLSASYYLGQKGILLKDIIGKSFIIDPYNALGRKVLVTPLPHPSGASTWKHKRENKALLHEALQLLKKELL